MVPSQDLRAHQQHGILRLNKFKICMILLQLNCNMLRLLRIGTSLMITPLYTRIASSRFLALFALVLFISVTQLFNTWFWYSCLEFYGNCTLFSLYLTIYFWLISGGVVKFFDWNFQKNFWYSIVLFINHLKQTFF